MQVIVNSDRTITGDERTVEFVTATVEAGLGRFDHMLTRVEVYLSDENSAAKGGGADKTCKLEARPANHQPVTVVHRAGEVSESVEGACTKMEHMLDHMVGKLDTKKGRTSYAGDQGF